MHFLYFPQIADDVKGLKWGNYVGSPSEPEPSLIWRQQCKDQKMASLHPLDTNDVLVLPQNMTAILRYNKDKGNNKGAFGLST